MAMSIPHRRLLGVCSAQSGEPARSEGYLSIVDPIDLMQQGDGTIQPLVP
jgi:hypothetical protein